MRILSSLVVSFLVCICVQSIPVGKFLTILDKSLVYQLTHPSTNTNSVRFLIDDLRAFKENLFRITKRIGMGRGYLMEYARNLSRCSSPSFIKDDIDFNDLQRSFNLTTGQLADVKILITQIKVNWEEFLKVSNSTEQKSDIKDITFFLIEKAGKNILEYVTQPSKNATSKLFTDLSNYYYGLGKLLKLFKANQEEMCEKCRPMYEQDKPVFLRSYINFAMLKAHFEMDDMQVEDFKKWVSKILFRWKIFTGFYELNKNLTRQPNMNNYNQLISMDNELRDVLMNPIPVKFMRLCELLDSFLLTLGLILRRNYPFREDIIDHVKATYKSGPPLFLRKYINFKHLKESFQLDEESFYKLRKKVFNIKNRWERLNIIELDPPLRIYDTTESALAVNMTL